MNKMSKNLLIKPLEKKALEWKDISGADKLKKDFEKFNKCYSILIEKEGEKMFTFCNDLIRHNFNKPFASDWKWNKIPEEIKPWFNSLKKEMEEFIDRGFAESFKSEKRISYNREKSREENNITMETLGFASYNDSFTKTIKLGEKYPDYIGEFNIDYGILNADQLPYFSTSFNSYDSCGQCQDSFLPKGTIVRAFWKKWDTFHLQTLTKEELEELLSDISLLEEYGPLHPNLIKE